MKFSINKTAKAAVPLLAGLALIALLIYISGPAKILEAIRAANLEYILLAIPFYPLIMLVYTYRWQFIIILVGDHLPLKEEYLAVRAGAFISDFIGPGVSQRRDDSGHSSFGRTIICGNIGGNYRPCPIGG
jgi:uncharacterized membrane protein YbhN (UPF0104 family)